MIDPERWPNLEGMDKDEKDERRPKHWKGTAGMGLGE